MEEHNLLKKISLGIASLALICPLAMNNSSQSANARRRTRTHRVYRHHRESHNYWHIGVPNVMKGKWRIHRNTGLTKIHHNYIDEFHRYAPVDDEDISHMHFHYQGHGKYLIKGYVHNAAVSNKYYHITLHAKIYNHHKMYYSGIRHGKFSDSAIYTKY